MNVTKLDLSLIRTRHGLSALNNTLKSKPAVSWQYRPREKPKELFNIVFRKYFVDSCEVWGWAFYFYTITSETSLLLILQIGCISEM